MSFDLILMYNVTLKTFKFNIGLNGSKRRNMTYSGVLVPPHVVHMEKKNKKCGR